MEHDSRWAERPRVEVVWHPDFAGGEAFAGQIYECLRISPERPLENKPGLSTRFWSDVGRRSSSEVVPGGGDACPAVVIVLIDDFLLGDKPWEEWLRVLALHAHTHHDSLRFIPIVASEQRQANVQLLGQMNFIEVHLDAAGRIEDDSYILNQILISILHFIDRSRLYYDVFLSYVREDGTRLRNKVLKGLDRYAFLRPFVDERDMVAGAPYRERFQTVIQSSAVLTLQTDLYSSRTEAVREFEYAKRQGRPIVVIDALEQGEPRSFPYIGNCRTVRLGRRFDTQRLVNVLLTEILRFELFRLETPRRGADGENNGVPPPVFHTGRTPDLHSLSDILSSNGHLQGASSPPRLCVYPDPPITLPELAALRRIDDSIYYVTPVQLNTVGVGSSELLRADGQQPLRGMTIQISASNPPQAPDLIDVGRRTLHVEESIIEFARYLISAGATLVFGGSFGRQSVGGWLLRILETYGWSEKPQAPRIQAYFPFPVGVGLTKEERANLGRLLYYQRISPPPDVLSDTNDGRQMPEDTNGPVSYHVWLRCLTEARQRIARIIDACILIGGKETGYKGRYAGVVEEALMTIQERKPLYVAGCMRGGAWSIARAFSDDTGWELAKAFDGTVQMQTESQQALRDYYNGRIATDCGPIESDHSPLMIDYERLREGFRQERQGESIGNNGLSRDENERLWRADSLEESVVLVLKGLCRVNAERVRRLTPDLDPGRRHSTGVPHA